MRDAYTQEPYNVRLRTPVHQSEFKFNTIREGHTFVALDKNYNHLLFLLEGEIVISCNEYVKPMHVGEFVLICMASDFKAKASSASKILTVSFEQFFSLGDVEYKNEIINLTSAVSYDFIPLPIRSPLDKFMDNLEKYLNMGINMPYMHELKLEELAIIMRETYAKEDMALLFYPLVGRQPDFRIRILRNYRKVKNIDDLATLMGMEKRTFSYYFKEEFGMSPYQWMLKQKAKHIQFCLIESRQSIPEIWKAYGFIYASHFNLFCKKHLHTTPKKIKLQYQPFN
jgi:AraC-like DNA-binding protein